MMMKTSPVCPHVFGRIIADEAQKLKTPATVTHRSVYDLQASHHLLLTITSIINPLHAKDSVPILRSMLRGRADPRMLCNKMMMKTSPALMKSLTKCMIVKSPGSPFLPESPLARGSMWRRALNDVPNPPEKKRSFSSTPSSSKLGSRRRHSMQGEVTSEPPVKGFYRGCCLLNNNQVSQSAFKPRSCPRRQDVPLLRSTHRSGEGPGMNIFRSLRFADESLTACTTTQFMLEVPKVLGNN